jgi:hypothetical protein
VRVPGQAEVTFTQPGGYVLYVERPGQCCSVAVGGGSAPFSRWSMKAAMQPANSGPPVSISTWRGAPESYGVAGHHGQTAMQVTIGHPGRYLLRATNVVPHSITDVAVGRGIGHGMLILLVLTLSRCLRSSRLGCWPAGSPFSGAAASAAACGGIGGAAGHAAKWKPEARHEQPRRHPA